jgi:hypothetical protein
VSYRVNLFPVSDFVSRSKPNTSRSCRTSSESSPTTPPFSLAGMSLHAGDLRPPRRRASPVRVGSRDIARRVRRTSVIDTMKTCSPVSHRQAAAGHAMHVPCPRSRRAGLCRGVPWPRSGRASVGRPSRCWAPASQAARLFGLAREPVSAGPRSRPLLATKRLPCHIRPLTPDFFLKSFFNSNLIQTLKIHI